MLRLPSNRLLAYAWLSRGFAGMPSAAEEGALNADKPRLQNCLPADSTLCCRGVHSWRDPDPYRRIPGLACVAHGHTARVNSHRWCALHVLAQQQALIDVTQRGSRANYTAGALERAGVSGDDVQEVFMGNVLSANLGQVRTDRPLL